jgi:PAS domain S-box-containing protein
MKQTLSQYEQKLLHKLHESEHFRESITDNTPDIIYVMDLHNGKFTFLNKRVNEIMGSDNILLDKIHLDDVVARARHIADCVYLKKGETKDIKIRMKVKSEAWHWFHIRDIPFKTNESGQVSHTIGVARDINNDMEHKEILHGVLKTHSLALVVYKAIRNADHRIEDFEFILTSKRFDDFQNRTDLIGKYVFQEFPLLRATQKEKWISVVETGAIHESEEQYPSPVTGNLHHFVVKLEKFNDGIMIIWDDITHMRNAGEESYE